MAYDRSLAQVTDDILALPDVRSGIEDPSNGLNNDFIRVRVRGMADQIFQAAVSSIEAFEKQEQVVAAARAELTRLTADPRDITFIQIVFGLAVFALVVIGPFVFFGMGPSVVLAKLASAWSSPYGSVSVGILVALSLVAGFRVYYYFNRVLPRRRRDLTRHLALDAADQQLADFKTAADRAVRDEVLKSILGLIASATQPFYQDRLFVPEIPEQSFPTPFKATTGRGLSEVVNSANEVPTTVRGVLLQMFKDLPGASIGICGPRGAGKSTLLSSICGANQNVGGQEAIAVHTSAPVEYENRDFMLHIFSCVCQQVLKAKGVPDDRRMPLREKGAKNLERPLVKGQSRLGWLLVWLGAATIMVSLLLTSLILDFGPDQPRSTTASIAAQPASPPTSPPTGATTAPIVTPAPAAPSRQQASGKTFVDVLELKPGQILPWGAVSILLGVILISFELISRLQEKYADQPDVPFPQRLFVQPEPQVDPGDPLVIKAQEHLHDIRFQRSYSSGWSGALKIPAGFEMGETSGTALAQRQESLPELVERFRGFVELVTRDYSRVIIGIDELDKLKSESEARKFINGIKAIFNLTNCFYLVSVSENAISNFERRGMPFRDEFDSAFDDILYVDYLTLESARHLLGRRVLNLPEAFLCLCYVLSAGLPRDLIRITRVMLEFAKMNPNSNSITDIAEALIAGEAGKKVRAIEIAARELSVEPETTEFLRQVTKLRDYHPRLRTFPTGTELFNRADLSDDDAINVRKLIELRRELDSFLYFSATTAEFFSKFKTQGDWSEAIGRGLVEKLGRARQAFELNVGVVEIRLDELRQSCGMPEAARWASKNVTADKKSRVARRRKTASES